MKIVSIPENVLCFSCFDGSTLKPCVTTEPIEVYRRPDFNSTKQVNFFGGDFPLVDGDLLRIAYASAMGSNPVLAFKNNYFVSVEYELPDDSFQILYIPIKLKSVWKQSIISTYTEQEYLEMKG